MREIRQVLFPTDFSPCAEQALPYATELARRHGAELHLLHAVVFRADDPFDAAHFFPQPEEVLRLVRESAEKELAALAAGQARCTVALREAKGRGMSVVPAILSYLEEHAIDLVVMGTHGGRAGQLLGSVAEQVVRHAHCPVLTVRQREGGGAFHPFRRVLVPVDFSAQSREALATARELAAADGGSVDLLHVLAAPIYPAFYGLNGVYEALPMEDPQVLRQRARKGLEELAKEAGGRAVPEELWLEDGLPAAEIERFARTHENDLIVLPSHGLTGVERFLLGSTAERVLHFAPCPVWILKPTKNA